VQYQPYQAETWSEKNTKRRTIDIDSGYITNLLEL